MSTLFALSILAFIPIMVMWLVYRVFLSNRNTPEFNRFFIVSGILVIAASIALSRFAMPDLNAYAASSVKASYSGEAATAYSQASPAGEHYASTQPAATVHEEHNPEHHGYLWRVLLWAYAIGMGLMSLGFIASMIRILCIIINSKRIVAEGVKFYITDNLKVSPFSIGNVIVTNRKDYERGGSMIIAHEMGHIAHSHTLDMILSQIMVITCWYNPFVWLLRDDLKMTHEYQADEFALTKGFDKFAYQNLLLTIASNRFQPSFANNFNYHNIKNRLTMMNSIKSPRFRAIAGIVPALLLGGAILFSCTNSKVQSAAESAQTETMAESTYDMPTTSDDYYVFLIRGVDVNSKAVTDGDFLYIGNLPYSDRADSSYEGFVYPITKCVVTGHKSVIDKLAPANAEYVIDNKKVTPDEYQALAADDIEIVTLENNQVAINTRRSPEEPNADVPAAGNEEGRQLHALGAQLEEAWPNLTTITVNGKDYDVKGTNLEEYISANQQLFNGLESLKIEGNTAIITTWPTK